MSRRMPDLKVTAGSVQAQAESDLYLYRPVTGIRQPAMFERLACAICGGVTFEVDRTEEGWCVECATCGDAASMFADLLNGDWLHA